MTTARFTPLFAAVALASGFTAAANAGTADWTQFNGLFSGNLTGGTDAQGSILVGGNFALNGGTVGALLGNTSQLGLGVVGNLTGGGNLNGGRAEIGGFISGGLNPNSGQPVLQGSPTIGAFFATAWTSAVDASAGFGNLATNSTTSAAPGNKLVFDARGESDFAVFTIDASDFSSYQSFQLMSDTEATIVVNVINANASNIGLNANMNEPVAGMGSTSFFSERERVVWNFTDATGTINVNRQVEGSVLALNAALNSAAVIEGSAVFASGNLNGQELHIPTFQGNTPPVPAPGALALAGLGGMIATRRRRA